MRLEVDLRRGRQPARGGRRLDPEEPAADLGELARLGLAFQRFVREVWLAERFAGLGSDAAELGAAGTGRSARWPPWPRASALTRRSVRRRERSGAPGPPTVLPEPPAGGLWGTSARGGRTLRRPP